jgi:hypothetical protein
MFADVDPFWFVSTELLTRVFHSETNVVTQLLARHPDFRDLLDAPEATVPERTACFALLAHRELVGMIDEKFVARSEESPSLDVVESNTLKCTYNLVSADAPAWVLEMKQVVERLPVRIYTSLPEPLRMGGFNKDNAEQMQAIESAKKTLSNVEQIRALTERVLDQQLQRLVKRWSAGISFSRSQPNQHPRTTTEKLGGQARRFNKRKGWERKLKLYSAVQNTLKRNPSLQGIEFCAELDKRHAPPLYDWVRSGEWQEGLTWKEAWADARLRRKIRRVRQEAQKIL